MDPDLNASVFFNVIIPDPIPGLLTLVSNIILSSGSKRLLLYCTVSSAVDPNPLNPDLHPAFLVNPGF